MRHNTSAFPVDCPVPIEGLLESDRDAPNAIGLPAECFTSEQFYEYELRTLWAHNWFCVGRDADVPSAGDYYTLDIGSEPLVVIRGDDGQVRVLSAVCQHRGMVVVTGRGNSRRLRCPFHSWTYSTTGSLLTAPDMDTVCDFDIGSTRLPELRSENWQGFRFVTFDNKLPTLAERLKRVAEELQNYEMSALRSAAPLNLDQYPCNWKLFSDECYHCSFLHARSWHRLFPTPRTAVDTLTPFNDVTAGVISYDLRGQRLDAAPTRTGVALHPILPRLTDEERCRLRYVTVMPNLVIVAMPDKVKYFLWLPTGPVSSSWGVSWLFPETTLQGGAFSSTWDMEREDLSAVMHEDIEAWTRTQKGMASRFAPRSRYAPTENVIVNFNRWCVKQYLKQY